jgi:pimeloyl-ACP methyl ester carboxylesterase
VRVRAAVVALLLVALPACRPKPEPLRPLVFDGQPVQIWRAEGARAAVVFLHGYRGDEQLVQGRHGDLAIRLNRAGWTLAASAAHGNAWGNDASVDHYERLVGHLRAEYGVQRVVLLGVSMGALAGLRLVERGVTNEFVGVSAVTDMTTLRNALLRRSIEATYGTVPKPDWDTAALRAAEVTFVADPADDVVDTASNSAALAAAVGAVLLPCAEKHTGRDCYANAGNVIGRP